MTEILQNLVDRPVIVGSGLAGLIAALTLSPEPCVLVTRAHLGAESSSGWAQGGIAACIGANDSVDLHMADTLAAGDGLCDAAAAAEIIAEAPSVIGALQRLGVSFDQDGNGSLALGLEAAHSRRRIVHAGGDGSGAAIIDALTRAVLADPAITVIEGGEARRILTTDGVVSGVLCASSRGGMVLPSSRILLASGGIGGLYEATTNPAGNFGQGIALAARAGAVLSDMEFVQFHPTALDGYQRPLPLISEAVRGEGAVLINERGERFMRHVSGAELAPRDVVARAISAEIARGGRVFLDGRRAIGARFASRFPTIHAACRSAGIDPAEQPIPVRPAAHYHMGGVATDRAGRSTVAGLWVAGEAASTGLHGANRLASNSLLEAAVMGIRAANDMRSELTAVPLGYVPPMPSVPDTTAVRPTVSRQLGVLRNAAGIHQAIEELLPVAEGNDIAADPAIVALIIAVSARLRTESRGAHARTDYPLKHAVAERSRITLGQALQIARVASASNFARSA
ncbi:L-aspartate oxidase [Rhizobium sp. 16-449-1b]|uniref:L-aspartate oxidase n=1 Tax=Rhizobium sp. 16-449-1b TaxID=2819989 RepID=UPI001ADB82D3|nr:L-aspartate oxidase [Rhizobium sp. 16-449-1b]MBO9195193.1 L-aspartate oxidase [Rhizobium sp. 16-449-1b]